MSVESIFISAMIWKKRFCGEFPVLVYCKFQQTCSDFERANSNPNLIPDTDMNSKNRMRFQFI